MMQSSSDLSKEILKSAFQEFTNVTSKQIGLLDEFFGDRNTRLQYLRLKANGTNKLHYTQCYEGFREMASKKDASKLETEYVKAFLHTFNMGTMKFIDIEGNLDITRFFCMSYLLASGSIKDKMLAIFQLIDENGDGYLTRTEVEKFFKIVLSDTFSVFKSCAENTNEFSVFKLKPENITQIKKILPEFEKIFDISKLERLVTGAFTADTNHDGLISYDEWINWFATGHYKEEWGTISLLFESY